MKLLQTPLHSWHVQHQARIVPFAGWDMPVQYKSVIDEHKAVRSSVGLFDVSHMARLSFSGKDAGKLLEKVCTNSVGNMKPLQVRYSLICNENGGILDDVLVYYWSYGYAMVVNASNREKIVAWLNRHAEGLDVQVIDQTETTGMIAIQGPKAVDLVHETFEQDAAVLKNYYAVPTRYGDKPCVVSRTGYTGEDGFEVMLPAELTTKLWQEWIDRGAVACGLGARDTLRLEAAMPLYGHELSETIDPLQAGLGWAVKLDKGDFIGRAALQARAAGNKMQRVGLLLEGRRAAREGSGIIDGTGKAIGTVTSGSYVPWLEKSIAMGYIPTELTSPGTAVQVDVKGSVILATIVALPFYKRTKAS